MKYGVDAVRDCVKNAEPIPVPGLKKFTEIQRMSLKDLDYMKTGISAIDEKCKFYFGELIILTGAAGEGKSTMASQWATMAIDQGYATMIYSGEMQSWLVKSWMDYQIAGRHNLNVHDGLSDEVYKKIAESEMYQKIYVYDPPEDEDDDKIQDKLIDIMLKGIKQYGIRFIVIDNLMTVMDCDGTMELNEAQTAYTRKLAKIAQNHGIIIVLIVHPRKSNSKSFSNEDIAGSSNIVNRAHKTIRYARMKDKFTDIDGNTWEKDEIPDCPIRELTVLKDRMTGETISKGIPLYFERETKRIAENKDFSWKLSWETDGGFEDVENLDEIPF
jgi:archaellum biogenesis ATPase FlaH